MPRKAKSLSFFAALPPNIKWALRSQPVLPVQQEPLDVPVPDSSLLPTQPEGDPDLSSCTTPVASTSVVISLKRATSDDSTLQTAAKRRKGKGKAPVSYVHHPWDCTGLVPRYTDVSQVPVELKKYFYQRHSLFPRYSSLPLLLDDTGWFSVTPHVIAAHIADRCRSDVILDPFCGVGGNAIEFARTCERVIAMDNDPVRLRLARHNALHHGVAERIEFVLADYIQWARTYAERSDKREEIDVVFLSPPWGGPDYLSFSADSTANDPHPSYPLSAILPIPGDELFALTVAVSPNIAYFLPRNIDVQEIGALASSLDNPTHDAEDNGLREREWVEIEEEWVGEKLKAVTAYFGGLIES